MTTENTAANLSSKRKIINPKNLAEASFGIIALVFTLFVYLPGDTFINNLNDFDFTYQEFCFIMLIPALIVAAVLELVALFLNEKLLKLYMSLLTGLNLCVYVQYMFLNSNLNTLIGDGMDWDRYTFDSVLSVVVWVLMLAVPFIYQMLLEKVWKLTVKKIPLFIGLIEAVSLVILIITASGNVFEMQENVFSGAEQYTVSKNKNIITIVLDATDNKYVKETLEMRPEAFEGYEDFTVYTNTCSVFDSTFQSFTQIYSGIEEKPIIKVADWNEKAWNSEKAAEFYKRFHEAGYKMNFFADANWDVNLLRGKADNIDVNRKEMTLQARFALMNDMNRLNAYRALPFILKRFLEVEGIDLNRYFENAEKYNFYNQDFQEGIGTMNVSESDKNYFIVEHTWGAHTPYDKGNSIDTVVYLLDIVREYIDKLKEFGVYDDSTIIIMGDHGSHDLGNYPDSTPMFMVKEPGRKSDALTTSSAPVYFADLMSIYLVNAGIYNEETDKELFGPSIYDFDEDSQRERVANYRFYDDNYPPAQVSPLVPSFGYNTIYSYRYTGDTDDLLEVIKNEGPESIEHMVEDAS